MLLRGIGGLLALLLVLIIMGCTAGTAAPPPPVAVVPTPTPTPLPTSSLLATERPTDPFLVDATFVDEQCGWLVRSDLGQRSDAPVHELLATCDGGQTWTTQYTSTVFLRDIDFISRQQGWMVISNTVQMTSDGGRTWQPFATAAVTSTSGIDFVDAEHGWVRRSIYEAKHDMLRTTDGARLGS